MEHKDKNKVYISISEERYKKIFGKKKTKKEKTEKEEKEQQ